MVVLCTYLGGLPMGNVQDGVLVEVHTDTLQFEHQGGWGGHRGSRQSWSYSLPIVDITGVDVLPGRPQTLKISTSILGIATAVTLEGSLPNLESIRQAILRARMPGVATPVPAEGGPVRQETEAVNGEPSQSGFSAGKVLLVLGGLFLLILWLANSGGSGGTVSTVSGTAIPTVPPLRSNGLATVPKSTATPESTATPDRYHHS